jgi:hypothetical protein
MLRDNNISSYAKYVLKRNYYAFCRSQLESVYVRHAGITDDKFNGTKAVPDSKAGVHKFRAPGHRGD